jgi:hypothetical protein
MLILNDDFSPTFYPNLPPNIGLKCFFFRAISLCVISFRICFIFQEIICFGDHFLGKSEARRCL